MKSRSLRRVWLLDDSFIVQWKSQFQDAALRVADRLPAETVRQRNPLFR